MENKLCLGSAQFDMNYGISRKSANLKIKEIYSILDFAYRKNVCCIDTANSYGDTEKILGKYDRINNFKIITKFNPSNLNIDEFKKIFLNQIDETSKNLNNQINTLLLHDISQLDSQKIKLINELVFFLKQKRIINKFGISIYSPKDYDYIENSLNIDVVQLPLNIFDQSLLQNNYLKLIKSKNIEIHVRSIFLQGLLLMSINEIPKYFTKWYNIFENWNEYLLQNKTDAVSACISFVKNIKGVDKIIIGFENLIQLSKIITIYENTENFSPFGFHTNDINLINPNKWKIYEK